MASSAGGQPPLEAVGPPDSAQTGAGGRRSFADLLQPQPSVAVAPVPRKQVTYSHGEPRIIWEEEEVSQMISNEQLEFAVVGKFSYGWPDIHVLRRLIPLQCELKGEVNIGLLSNRYILIRASRMRTMFIFCPNLFFILLIRIGTTLCVR